MDAMYDIFFSGRESNIEMEISKLNLISVRTYMIILETDIS